MTAQAPVVQGAVSEALSEQDIAFGADLWRRRNVSEAEIPLSRPRYWGAFSSQFRLETHKRQRLPYLQNAAQFAARLQRSQRFIFACARLWGRSMIRI